MSVWSVVWLVRGCRRRGDRGGSEVEIIRGVCGRGRCDVRTRARADRKCRGRGRHHVSNPKVGDGEGFVAKSGRVSVDTRDGLLEEESLAGSKWEVYEFGGAAGKFVV